MRSGERRKRRRAKAQRPDPVPGILGEVRCLKLELDTERSQAEQERETAARQLARAEQEGQTALQQQKSAHEEEVKQLQEKWVGGGCGVVRGAGPGRGYLASLHQVHLLLALGPEVTAHKNEI